MIALLAVGREGRPDVRHRRVVVELTPLRKQVRDGRRDALRYREGDENGVAVDRAACRDVGDPRPGIDDELAAVVGGNLEPDLRTRRDHVVEQRLDAAPRLCHDGRLPGRTARRPTAEAAIPTRCDSIAAMTTDTPTTPHRPTLMTVHAHPDDETIGTGGTMAKAVAAGPPGHPRHGHPRRARRDRRPRHGHAGQPSPARRDPGRRAGAGDGLPRRHRVGEPRLPRLGDDGHRRQPRPALLLAGRPRRGRRTARLARPAATSRTSSRPTTSSAATGTPTTSGPTTSRSGRSSGPATRPGTRSSSRSPGSAVGAIEALRAGDSRRPSARR